MKGRGVDRRRRVNEVEFARHMFAEVIRPRESIIRFSEPRVVLADNPQHKLQKLFAFYVERNFVTKEYKETILEKGVRKWLVQAQIADRFQRMAIGDDEYQANFPFVEQVDDTPVKIIKPLNLAQDKPSKIIEHGGVWRFRLDELRRRGKLPQRVLFTVAGPEDIDTRRHHAFNEAVDRLEDAGIEVVGATERGRIIDFARAQ